MLATYVSDLALGFAAFRLGLAAVTLLALVALWKRPHPLGAVAVVLATHLACWAAYRAPLERPYALERATDRAFNLGMAATTAAGNSPFEHTQVRLKSPEPLWNVLVAALAGFHPDFVATAWDALTPLSLCAVALGLYFGLRQPQDIGFSESGLVSAERWENALIVFAVLGLSSLTMSGRPPTPPFWLANFMLKPHHAASYGLVAIAMGLASRDRQRPWALAAVLALLAWAALLNWAFLVAGLVVSSVTGSPRRIRAIAIAVALSVAAAAPYFAHLAADYGPGQSHGAAEHMWTDPHGLPLAVPNWSTLDLGPLLSLGAFGVWAMARRGAPRDRTALGVLAAAAGLWAVSMPAAIAGVAPEPDDLHYFLRFAAAIAAGSALAVAGRGAESAFVLGPGRGHVLALAACLPFSFPYYWDPPTMDRYYPMSLRPVSRKVLDYADWIRLHTPPDAVFLAGPTASTYIPALAGRRVLVNDRGQLKPRDYADRKEAERVLLTSRDPGILRATAARFGVTYLAVDPELSGEYGEEALRSEAYRTVFQNSAARIVEVDAAAERPPR